MKVQKIHLLLCLILVMILAAGCAQFITGSGNPPSSATSTLAATSSISTLIIPPTPTDTPIALPTLPVEQARVRLLELLANNGNCRLPCLWGIVPGKSTYQEAQAILAPLSSISDLTKFTSDSGTISPLYTEGDLTLYSDAGFLSDNQIISHIVFRAREEQKIVKNGEFIGLRDIFNSQIFGERLRPYMLSQVLSEQGAPTAVLIQTNGPTPRSTYVSFDVLLLYPDQGLLVHYSTNTQVTGKNIRGCLANAHVEMELYPAGHGDSFAQFLSQTQWAGIWPLPAKPYWMPVEKVTGMSLEQFYETFRQPTDKCIETPAKLWPTPESGGG